ncbi:MAG: ParB/RepB/Spo0J family partition protein [Bacteroidales bacterium]|nr:ParB/RepB/Spo0J family partition protein [Bacteroidales bacterium]MCF8402795.1 ParB/RepB/Spo0J family partition protein [Bacteroidales bacterium]
MKTKKSALGRGLSAILESPETDITSKDISGNYVVGAIANLSLDKIEANPFQPRDRFEEVSLRELAKSIEEQGIIQPVTVRKLGYDQYQLISGERRFKAARMVGLNEIPCYIRVANDQQMLELALIENIHRKDLNPVEIAISYQRLLEECKITQEELSDKVGKDRSTITNYIRLLKLPPQVQLALQEEKLSMGHARAIINIEDENTQRDILNRIIKENLSVRDVENIVKSLCTKENSKAGKIIPELDEKHFEARGQLENNLETPVNIRRNNNGKGSIVISFKSERDFDRIMSVLEKLKH